MEVLRHASTFLLPPAPPPMPAADGPSTTYALVVLNQRLPRFSPVLWSHAKLRIFADGGANRVYDGMPKLFPEQDPLEIRCSGLLPFTEVPISGSIDAIKNVLYKPDVIRGDMDSIRPEVMDFYANLGVKIEDVSYDQDTTDLHKCVTFICDSTPQQELPNLCILVAGALGGRFDHEAGNINVLYKFANTRIILLSDDCLIHLLPKTHRHEIYIQSSVEGPHCGLIPIGAPSVSTTTSGLQWDLSDTGMSFGGLISTSNIVREDRISVQSDTDLLWTISVKKDI